MRNSAIVLTSSKAPRTSLLGINRLGYYIKRLGFEQYAEYQLREAEETSQHDRIAGIESLSPSLTRMMIAAAENTEQQSAHAMLVPRRRSSRPSARFLQRSVRDGLVCFLLFFSHLRSM